MRNRDRKSFVRRLLSMMAVVAFALTTMIGSVTHACHATGAHEHDTAASSIETDVVASSTMEAVSSSDFQDHAPSRSSGELCLDVLCHGGFVVLPISEHLVLASVTGLSFAPGECQGNGLLPPLLDRPPAALRS